MGIGKRIKDRREEIKMSQDELAKKLGYKSRSSITKIEKEFNDLPIEKVEEIAAALNTSPKYLMAWDSNEPSDNRPIDDNSRELLDRVRHSDGMRMLFSVTKDCTEEDIQTAIKIIKALRDESKDK